MTIDHYHCPHNCEKPQSFDADGKQYCGRCVYEGRGAVECYVCTPDSCPEDE